MTMRERVIRQVAVLGGFMLLVAVGLPVAAHAASEPLAEVDGIAITAE